MSTPLDSSLCQELKQHIEALTHTGLKQLDSELLKKVKRICKLQDGYVEHTYHLLLHQLEIQHSEVRFSCFQIIDELFRRSNYFRELLISNLQHIIELTTETSSKHLLPPPNAAAKRLRDTALRCFHEWNKEYGEGYKRLSIGYNFLKKCKKVDFTTLELEDSFEQRRIQERRQHLNNVNKEKLKRVMAEYSDNYQDIQNSVAQIENCISLLVPSLEEFFISEENPKSSNFLQTDNAECFQPQLFENTGKDMNKVNYSEEEADEHTSIREHGMLNPHYSVEVEFKPVEKVKETAENSIIFENCRELHQLIQNRYIPSVKKWMLIATKCSASLDDMKKFVDLKKTLENVLKKCNQLDMSSNRLESDSDSSNSDLEEVPEKDGYEETVKEDTLPLPFVSNTQNKLKIEEGEWSIISRENNKKDPTTLESTLVTGKLLDIFPKESVALSIPCSSTKIPSQNGELERVESVPSTSKDVSMHLSRKEKLMKIAPKLPFDIDLYHWEDENIKAPTMLMTKPDGARFWSATSVDELDEIAVPDGVASLRTRVIEFTGKHEPVKWACRAPLPSGKLCPRRDKNKCPFHGIIVPRDNTGKCSNPEDEARIKQSEDLQKVPDWQEPKLLEEIKNATGIDLKIPEKGKKRKKSEDNKFPGLTDIKAKQNNAYTRLSKKVFKKSTMKKVAGVMDAADHKRFRDKYGDQFHYIHETA